MSTAEITAWRSLVRDELPNCAVTIVDRIVLDTLIDFCTRAMCWQVHLDPQHVLANRSTLELNVPRETRLVTIIELKYLGKKLTPAVKQELDSGEPHWETRTGAPTRYTMLNSQTVRLIGIPEERVERALTGTVAVKPSRAATTVDADLFEDWAHAIAFGAKARIFGMKVQAWFDPTQAKQYQALYDEQVTKATSAAAKGYTRRAKRRTTPCW